MFEQNNITCLFNQIFLITYTILLFFYNNSNVYTSKWFINKIIVFQVTALKSIFNFNDFSFLYKVLIKYNIQSKLSFKNSN